MGAGENVCGPGVDSTLFGFGEENMGAGEKLCGPGDDSKEEEEEEEEEEERALMVSGEDVVGERMERRMRTVEGRIALW